MKPNNYWLITILGVTKFAIELYNLAMLSYKCLLPLYMIEFKWQVTSTYKGGGGSSGKIKIAGIYCRGCENGY